MKNHCCGCSLKLRVLLFLWIETIIFTTLLFITLTEIEAYGTLIHTSCVLIFAVFVPIKSVALYGVIKNKPSFLVPQMSGQIIEIIIIAFFIFAVIIGFSFISEVFDFFMNKTNFPKEIAEKMISFVRCLVMVPLITIFVAKCCLAKMVHSYYVSVSLVLKKTVTNSSAKIDNLTSSVNTIPMQPLTAVTSGVLSEMMI